MKKLLIILMVTLTALSTLPAVADCTSFSWSNQDESLHFLGRTYDYFGTLEANRISIVPVGYDYALNPEGSETATVKYGFVAQSMLGLASPIVIDGMNEKGLMACLLNYPGYAVYNTNDKEGAIDIHPSFFLGYILGNCASVEEAAAAIENINLTDELIFGEKMSVHYIISDSTGEAMIVEPDEGGISVHRNTIGVMANAPGYEWQKTNLRNYVAISNLDTPPVEILGETFSAFGVGTGGSFGLPGGYSSPARFARIAFTKQFAPKGTDEIDSVTRMFHNFAVVDIPEGLLRESSDSDHYELSLCITVMCSESGNYYFSPYTDRRINCVNVHNALDSVNGTEISYIEIPTEQDINYII